MGRRKLITIIIVSLLIITIISVFIVNKNNNEWHSKTYKEIYQSFTEEADANITQIKEIGQKYKELYQKKEDQEQKNKNEDELVSVEKHLLDESKEEEEEILYKYRFLSCILGAFYGDCIGSYCEFERANALNHDRIFSNRGHWKNTCDEQEYLPTDDSEKAMALAYAIMCNPNCSKIDYRYIIYHYYKWLQSYPFDIGINTMSLNSIIDDNDLDPAKGIDGNENTLENIYNKIQDSDMMKSSLANGSLMHLSPLICWVFLKNKDAIRSWNDDVLTRWSFSIDEFKSYNIIKNQIKADTTCTNPNEGSIAFATILTCITLFAINGNNPHMISDMLESLIKKEERAGIDLGQDGIKNDNFATFFKKCVEFYDKNNNHLLQPFFIENFPTDEGNIGWAGHAIRIIRYILVNWDNIEYAAKKENKSMYRFIMDAICDLGGDTDTNCAIVGTVIGPLIGYNNFDKEENSGHFYNHFLKKPNTATLKNLFNDEEDPRRKQRKIETAKAKRMIYSTYTMYDYVSFLINMDKKGMINPKTNGSDIRNDEYLQYYDKKINKIRKLRNE